MNSEKSHLLESRRRRLCFAGRSGEEIVIERRRGKQQRHAAPYFNGKVETGDAGFNRQRK
jgi:hypothetical protein